MPLSPPAPRKRLHERRVRYEGYLREDGLIDIEAHLLDTKDHDFLLLSGLRPAGTPVHEMGLRVTIDRHFTIHRIEAVTEAAPYMGGCDEIADAYRKLEGASLVDGFRKRLYDAVGGVKGCTHLTELLAFLPTAAIQTFASLRTREDEGAHKPYQLDRCHALETSSETVARYYPKWHRGAA